MITEKQIEIAQALIATGEVSRVYHSVELIEDKKGAKFPAYAVGGEQFYCGPDDSRGRFAYIRQTRNVEAGRPEQVGSCAGMYLLKVPLRIVVFSDHEKENHDALLQRLLGAIFMQGVTLVTFHSNAFQLSKQESPIGDFAFDSTTFYAAIDVMAVVPIDSKMCAEDKCIVHPNPICK